VNDDEIAEVLTAIEVAWPRDRPDGWQRLWAAQMRDIPSVEATPALELLIRTKSFPPSIAELREAVAEIMGALPPADGAVVGLAWAQARELEEMTHVGPTATTLPSIQAAVSAFGGPGAVTGDQDGWERFWRRWAASERERVLVSHLDRLALGS